MNEESLELLVEFGMVAFAAVLLIILLVLVASSTSLGRAVLPDSVVDIASRLLPQAVITDAEANFEGEFRLQVRGAMKLKTIQVHRSQGVMTAWAFDPDVDCPQSGTFALYGFSYDIDEPGPAFDSSALERRVSSAVTEVLNSKNFTLADASTADILVRISAAFENVLPLDNLGSSLGHQGNREWQLALATALKHAEGSDGSTIAKGSLLLYLTDARTQKTVWRAAAVGKIVVDVGEPERARRVLAAVEGMLRRFPPS